ncbi:MAG TPA: tetratricopeptide repeat protein, partial [Lentisphaeria bacterium]|nr:tetratricopeptide repeat protein [Lentisphaeria bacterium]
MVARARFLGAFGSLLLLVIAFSTVSAPGQEGNPNPADVQELLKAAEQGNADAQCKLGIMYHDGEGAPKDLAEAVKWLRKAAEQGHADAQSRLGYLYATGEGVPKDLAEAFEWTREAAKQGEAKAQHNLAGLYYDGEGV